MLTSSKFLLLSTKNIFFPRLPNSSHIPTWEAQAIPFEPNSSNSRDISKLTQPLNENNWCGYVKRSIFLLSSYCWCMQKRFILRLNGTYRCSMQSHECFMLYIIKSMFSLGFWYFSPSHVDVYFNQISNLHSLCLKPWHSPGTSVLPTQCIKGSLFPDFPWPNGNKIKVHTPHVHKLNPCSLFLLMLVLVMKSSVYRGYLPGETA